jgi:ribosomal protein S18 acetylase RimI-like enzyme
MIIFKTQLSDLQNIARCHRLAFPNSLSTALGLTYCSSMYSWYLFSNYTFLFHLLNTDGKFVGYCGGMIIDENRKTGSASGMIQHTFYIGILSLLIRPWLFFHKEFRYKISLIVKNIKLKFFGDSGNILLNVNDQSPNVEQKVGLVVIGVSPEYQGLGFGSQLLIEFERIAKDDFKIFNLELSVLSTNSKAIKSYLLNGWKESKSDGKTKIFSKKLL